MTEHSTYSAELFLDQEEDEQQKALDSKQRDSHTHSAGSKLATQTVQDL